MNPVSRRIVGLGLLSSLLTFVLPARAIAKPTIKCRYLGQTTTYNNRLFTCIKVKSKGKTVLVWDSGKLLPIKPSPTSPTPSPMASSTSPTPSPEKVAPSKREFAIATSTDVPENQTRLFAGKNSFGYSITYVLARNGGVITAMSGVCTHNGCTVKIDSEGLLCPCHNALFNPKDGAVLRGPAAHALERVTVREAEGTIYLTD
jgi:Rieske Fe-S protein